MAELIRARDRITNEVGEYTREFLDTWSADYFILGPVEAAPKTPKPSALAASHVPDPGTNPEGGA